jgi:hypothetical protein
MGKYETFYKARYGELPYDKLNGILETGLEKEQLYAIFI